MKSLAVQPQGSRIASIHNGSSLFTGDAGQGESNIRRYVIENDLVEAIIQLPNNIFYNTGISTYVWLLSNKKAENRRNKVQLIDASQAFEKLRKNQGSRNCTITAEHTDLIVKTYLNFEETDNGIVRSKIFNNDDFRYFDVIIERPLRLRCQFTALKCDELLFENNKQNHLYKWLYEKYGDAVFNGLSDKLLEIKDYFEENEIKVTDKQRAALLNTEKWKARLELKTAANMLMHSVGTEVYMDYNQFFAKVKDAAKKVGLKLTDANLKKIARAMSETDPEAAPVIAKIHKPNSKDVETLNRTFGINHNVFADYGLYAQKETYIEYEPDADLRDHEKVSVNDDIYQYFLREVRPYVDDAWIALPETKIGCEISFNKYFYQPTPLRSLDENQRDIIALESESRGFIEQLFND